MLDAHTVHNEFFPDAAQLGVGIEGRNQAASLAVQSETGQAGQRLRHLKHFHKLIVVNASDGHSLAQKPCRWWIMFLPRKPPAKIGRFLPIRL